MKVDVQVDHGEAMRTLQEVQEQHQRKESEYQVCDFRSLYCMRVLQGQYKDSSVHAQKMIVKYPGRNNPQLPIMNRIPLLLSLGADIVSCNQSGSNTCLKNL